MTTDLTSIILDRVQGLSSTHGGFANEQSFHDLLAEALGDCSSKVSVNFDPAVAPATLPPPNAVQECLRKGKVLPAAGKDPCDGQRRVLDILWHVGNEHVPIEVKYRDRWGSDVYGYEFLKDVHRLERLSALKDALQPTNHRYAIFLTPIADYWSDASTREPKPFRLTHGRSIPAKYWVQYDQLSAVTKWYSYPPFYLSHAQTFQWNDAGPAGRCLIVRVLPQARAYHRGAWSGAKRGECDD